MYLIQQPPKILANFSLSSTINPFTGFNELFKARFCLQKARFFSVQNKNPRNLIRQKTDKALLVCSIAMSLTCCRTNWWLCIYKQSDLQVITECVNASVLNTALKFRSQNTSLKIQHLLMFFTTLLHHARWLQETVLEMHCCNSALKRDKILEMSTQSLSNTSPGIIKYRLYFHSHVLYKMSVPLLCNKHENYNCTKEP